MCPSVHFCLSPSGAACRKPVLVHAITSAVFPASRSELVPPPSPLFFAAGLLTQLCFSRARNGTSLTTCVGRSVLS